MEKMTFAQVFAFWKWNAKALIWQEKKCFSQRVILIGEVWHKAFAVLVYIILYNLAYLIFVWHSDNANFKTPNCDF